MRPSRAAFWILSPAFLAIAGASCSLGRDGHEAAPAEPFPPEALRVEPRPTASGAPAPDDRREERQALAAGLARDGILDERVLGAIRRVPRHAFVIPAMLGHAYDDRALPIVGGQTISQPYVVAFMTEAARPEGTARCLEIGTGSGYQAAVLAELCGRVHSIEYLPEVARFGESNLRAAGYGPERVALRVGDGYRGWSEFAPFDVILITAAPERVPEPLLDQLAPGGRLVVPVGPQASGQVLERWTRVAPGSGAGAFQREPLLDVRFVPFLGGGKEK